jgi:hypothetical protein
VNISMLASRLREKIGKFSGEVSSGLGKVAGRFLGDLIYGMQASQSVVLSEVGRVLGEAISVKKTEERLSRNLAREGLEDIINRNIASFGAKHIKDETLLVIDVGDLSKKYAKKMEYLARVWNGSEGKVTDGYFMIHVIGTELDSNDIVPLYQRLFSQNAPGFDSENEEILRAMSSISEHVKNRGIWVMDRGGDRIKLFRWILDHSLRFLFRIDGDRHLVVGNQKLFALEIANKCRCPYAKTISRIEDGKEKKYEITFGFRRVRLPARKEQLYLLVVKGFGVKPLMVLTNVPLRKGYRSLEKIMESYFRRWGIEETIRYVKTVYGLENVRVLRYRALQNLMSIILAVTYFAAVELHIGERLRIMVGHILKAAKRIFGIPSFKCYAVADGLKAIFSRHPGCPRLPLKSFREEQMLLFPIGHG